MELEHRISFVKPYAEYQKAVIDAKIDQIKQRMKSLNIGPSSFQLSNEITCTVIPEWGSFTFAFSYKDDDRFITECEFSAKALLIAKWKDIEKEILEQKAIFDNMSLEIFSFKYTRENLGVITAAYNKGYPVIQERLSTLLESTDFTKEELEALIRNGFGYDLYETLDEDLQHIIARNFRNYYVDEEKLQAWIKEYPERCLLPENRAPKLVSPQMTM